MENNETAKKKEYTGMKAEKIELNSTDIIVTSEPSENLCGTASSCGA